MENELHYDFQSFLLSNGNIADKVRLITASKKVPKNLREEILNDLKSIQNSDGGIPFGFRRGAPSSVKETAELLTLVSKFKNNYRELIDAMSSFLISRQKSDGGFGESLILDPYIEDKWSGIGRDWYPVGKSITWLTGKALESLCLVNYSEVDRLKRARDFLLNLQHEDGHWPDYIDQNISDPLATGNILHGLRAAGVPSNHKVYIDGRAALLQHLSHSLESKSIFDLADLTAFGKPESAQEKKILKNGIVLIIQTQNSDGGWIPLGAKKSDPELSSILLLEFTRANELI